jgi:hypothetical protein
MMGYQCYELNGRDQGYGVPAKCDHPDCDEDIDRGMGFACGGDPMENCGLFFCHNHRRHDVDPEADWTIENRHTFGVCERCATRQEPFDPTLDTEYWRAWKMNHESWRVWRDENPQFVKANGGLVGHVEVMREIIESKESEVNNTYSEACNRLSELDYISKYRDLTEEEKREFSGLQLFAAEAERVVATK